MNKLFKLTQTKGKWHKFPSFDLGWRAKLYKNFAQKLLAVSLCAAVVLLGTPVTTFASTQYNLVLDGNTITGVKDGNNSELTEEDAAAITTIEIPATVTDIAEGAFDQCTSLDTFTVAGGTAFSVDDSTGALYSYSATDEWATLYRLPPAFEGEYELPSTVTDIKDGAFTNCAYLQHLSLASTGAAITDWTDFSFSGCASLASFSGGNSIAAHATEPFLYDYVYPASRVLRVPPAAEGAVQLGNMAGLTTVVPGALSGCSSVAALWPTSTSLSTEGTSDFFSRMSGAPVLVPAAFVDADTSDNINISSDDPASVFGYATDSSNPKKLLITSRSGDLEKPLELACNTFDGYTLAVDDGATIDNLTITHTYGAEHTCPSCGADKPTVPVTGVSLNKTSLELTASESATLTATVFPADATNQALMWTVENDAAAGFVDDAGQVVASLTTAASSSQSVTVKGLAAGSATIYAKTSDGSNITAECAVEVTQPVESVSLNLSSLKLKIGQTYALTATVLPENATNNNVTWSSSKEAVATVDENGTVTARALGTATITVTTENGNKQANCQVTVVDTGVSVDRSSWGTPYTRGDGVVQYVVEDHSSPDFGMTSVEIAAMSGGGGFGGVGPISWVLESSGGSSAWYGLRRDAVFPALPSPGYRFYVQWLSPGDAGYAALYDQLDAETKQQVERDNGWLFNMGIRAPDGSDVHYLSDADGNSVSPIVYVQIGDDWDVDDLNAYYIAAGADETVPVDYLTLDYPGGTDTFGRMTLDHFSPYFIFDELTANEKATLVQEGSGSADSSSDSNSGAGTNAKTGDLAAQLTVACLGLTLVLALGIMLRLLTNKRKFDE